MSQANKKYWFLLAYMVQQPGLWVPRSILIGADTENLTVPQLNNFKQAYGVPDTSVLMSVSTLGYMTEKEINGLPEIDPPTKISHFYRQGMVAATRVNPADTSQPTNPYGATCTPEDMANASEWLEGFQAVRNAQADSTTPVPRLEVTLPPEKEAVNEAPARTPRK